MMQTLPVLFYDGQSSSARKALLILKPGFWLISYSDAELQSHSIRWDVDQLSRVDVVNGVQIFRYGSYPQQVIECSGTDLLAEVKRHYPYSKVFNSSSLTLRGWKNIAGATIVLIALLASVYLYILPSIAAFVAGKIPQNIETQLGGSMLNSFIAGAERDRKLSLLLNKFAGKIDFKTSYPIEITAVNDEMVNAFALPGGKIVVYDGILKKMERPEELAALLSHEVAHIEYKHSLKSISRNLAGYIFISLVFNDINGVSTVLIDNAHTLKNLSYSRELETDADYRALSTLEANQISQQGMVALFEMLKTRENFSYLKFLGTHPLTSERIAYTKARAKKQKQYQLNKELLQAWTEIQAHLKNRQSN